MKTHKRLYIFTGKGGVGKTSLAMAMTKHLEALGLNPKYNSFFQDPDRSLWKKLNLPVLDIDLNTSAEMYIGRKLNSKTIASWIMKTHFFKSLFQMIPGLGHMILLGHIIDDLEKDPKLIIVLDSPASGHALTMFESSSNFKKIFRAGMIVKDIDKMHAFLSAENAINNGTSTVQYSMDRRVKDPWNFIVGSQFQLNKHFMLRAEYGFLGSRTQIMTGLQYRFGL